MTVFIGVLAKKNIFNVNFVLIFYKLSAKQVFRFQLTLFLYQIMNKYSY